MNDQALLSIVVSPEAADAMVDWMLEQAEVAGFTSYRVNGHGSSIHSMSLAEQVAGSCQQVLFQMHLSVNDTDTIINRLKSDFGDSGIHYWLTPLIHCGHL